MIHLPRSTLCRAAAMCGRAYQDNEAFSWVVPEPEVRRKLLAPIFETRIRFGLLSGEVFATSLQVEAIAQLVPSERSSYTLPKILRSGVLPLVARMGYTRFSRMLAMGNEADGVPKQVVKGSFVSLLTVAVDPILQGKGYASRLLHPMMKLLDDRGMQCVLETTTVAYVSFYEHFGFKTIVDATLRVTGGTVRMWYMLRPPN
jgi:ribosomal protein S18 acetylase RimI-like enzyme